MVAVRTDYLPSPSLPLAYFAGAHAALALAMAGLLASPDLGGTFHYQPRMIALVHLVTVGWISGSILGAYYIVAPLALGAPMRVGWGDHVALALFWSGVLALVAGFWTGRFALVGLGALPLLAAVAFVGSRVAPGVWRSKAPGGVALHVSLGFINMLLAILMGLALAANRLWWQWPVSPLSLAVAHGHLAMLGWVLMTVVGVGYRLVPMFLPAAMPGGPGLAASAVLLEAGALGLASSLAAGWPVLPSAIAVMGACVAFFLYLGRMLRNRRPRPADLPKPDWSTWQTQVALAYLLATLGLGAWLVVGAPPSWAAWLYGGAGILGFAAQMVVGIQGRLVPMQAWYRSMGHRGGEPPAISVHVLIRPPLARAILIAWSAGVPLLVGGLASGRRPAIAAGAALLLAATCMNAAHGALMARRASAAPSGGV